MYSKTKIISAFCGVGKTHMCNSNSNCIEFECWKYQSGDFPNNYVKDIQSAIGKFDYVFISTNPVGLKRLNELGIDITLVYPKSELKEEYLKRYEKRGSHDEFITMLNENWYKWLNELKEQSYCEHIELEESKYLLDIL